MSHFSLLIRGYILKWIGIFVFLIMLYRYEEKDCCLFTNCITKSKYDLRLMSAGLDDVYIYNETIFTTSSFFSSSGVNISECVFYCCKNYETYGGALHVRLQIGILNMSGVLFSSCYCSLGCGGAFVFVSQIRSVRVCFYNCSTGLEGSYQGFFFGSSQKLLFDDLSIALCTTPSIVPANSFLSGCFSSGSHKSGIMFYNSSYNYVYYYGSGIAFTDCSSIIISRAIMHNCSGKYDCTFYVDLKVEQMNVNHVNIISNYAVDFIKASMGTTIQMRNLLFKNNFFEKFAEVPTNSFIYAQKVTADFPEPVCQRLYFTDFLFSSTATNLAYNKTKTYACFLKPNIQDNYQPSKGFFEIIKSAGFIISFSLVLTTVTTFVIIAKRKANVDKSDLFFTDKFISQLMVNDDPILDS